MRRGRRSIRGDGDAGDQEDDRGAGEAEAGAARDQPARAEVHEDARAHCGGERELELAVGEQETARGD